MAFVTVSVAVEHIKINKFLYFNKTIIFAHVVMIYISLPYALCLSGRRRTRLIYFQPIK